MEKDERKLIQRWVTIDFGENVECKVQIWCREGSTEPENLKSAVSMLNTKVGLLHETLSKPRAEDFAWNITTSLGR
jgi:hypothetical protein